MSKRGVHQNYGIKLIACYFSTNPILTFTYTRREVSQDFIQAIYGVNGDTMVTHKLLIKNQTSNTGPSFDISKSFINKSRIHTLFS